MKPRLAHSGRLSHHPPTAIVWIGGNRLAMELRRSSRRAAGVFLFEYLDTLPVSNGDVVLLRNAGSPS